ncbi:MAG: lytic transglycosylase domain-containing protein [Bryobacteraceae bacterium]|nr:lytic transglycosylase domain-containing protein [Bryobacteraceae bacterium]
MAGVVCSPGLAGDHIVLRTGFRIQAESHQRVGDVVHVRTPGGGTLQIAAAAVDHIEPGDPPPSPTAEPTPAPPTVPQTVPPGQIVTDAAIRNGLPPEIVHAVAKVESGYKPHAVSPKGAKGLMQLMPATAKALNADPDNPQENADAGARYLRELLLKYKSVSLALAAYNAGPGNVEKYDGVPPFPETQRYIRKVIAEYWRNKRKATATPPAPTASARTRSDTEN